MENKIISLLTAQGVGFRLLRHPAVYTAAAADRYVQGERFARAKNLFLHSSQGFFLIMASDHGRVDMHKLKQALATTLLSFARPAELAQQLGIQPGAVSPFNLINNRDHQVTLVVDQHLLEEDAMVGCHPNDNTMTVVLKFTDLLALVRQWGNPVKVVYL